MTRISPRRIAVSAAPGSVDHLLGQLDLPVQATTLVVNGGTSDDAEFPEAEVSAALRVAVQVLAARPGPVIVSGGTDAGLFRLLGGTVAELGFSGPVIGVVPAGKITRVNGTPLEPHHSHVLMVDTDTWGGETSTMLEICRALGGRGRVLALVAGGGEQTLVEIDGHRTDRRPVIVLAGTGRLADDLASSGPTAGLSVVDVGDVDAVRVVVAGFLT
jgi:hypothetical protein